MAKRTMTPWKSEKDLKRFWVLAASLGGEQFVYDAIWIRYTKKRLHDLTRAEFYELLREMQNREKENQIDKCTCEEHHGWASCGQYRRIKYLQRRLEWDDKRLLGYIRKYAHVDAIRFLTCEKARGVIAGMEKMLKRKKGGNKR